ncbi:asparagine synthase (glutamine-hydrolyzing) [Evansella cellulosilytica]|uniref:asparagine synthase (glutamine-hydrolyzing) n=1 Tax=Evansella cellulosilytica (strain ATCC 21833 / DSM 2522 / FERM P-1141 / JCM 9156 / N-4) TaxID=649639 RepID=E6TYI4_EVAC2|nr:asparagine synthase (glutamine-hydrolyzing) [Evansella cellulosilytica]ADU30034.1 asparagine synthase (glutamine-hydrolyzing) [Evansella cellulosilytica DSM 2522]
MCGITGWVDFHRPLKNEHKTIEAMAHTLNLRGPDTSNAWLENNVAFGHKRLIVVDPKGGAQPMVRKHREKKFTICYNGELYNTEDIRQELLSAGFTFESHSDTEVLLTAYIHWREACVDKLNGIYAFAIWDEEKEQVFLVRDRLGVKPLFFYKHREGILFGSELKAILAHPEVNAEIGEDGLREVFGLSPSRTPGNGVYKGMEELRPAHWMRINKDGVEKRRYWQVESKEHTDSLNDTADNVRSLFIDTVQRQLVADVPVCTFLSGGVDSSAITAVASQYFKEQNRGKIKTYSIDYEDNEKYFKESKFQPNADGPWIEKMRDAFQTEHHPCVINQNDLYDYLKSAVFARDLPGMADIDSSLLWFCKEIKKDVTVGLSGECADEIFGGYPWFHDEEMMNRPTFPWMSSVEERQLLLHPKWKKRLQLTDYVQDKYQETLNEVPYLDGETGMNKKRRELFYVNMIWFMTTLLDRKDRMSMAASLEVRVPFADHRLVEYVWNIPWEMKMHQGREKGILRKALEGILPDEVLYRKKSPYPKTHNPVYTKLVTEGLANIIKKGDSPLFEFFDRKQLMALVESNGESFKRPYFGQLMTGPQLIAHLIQVHTWLSEYDVKIN